MPRDGSWECVLGFGMATKACCSLQMVFSGWVYISSWQHYDGTVPLLYSSLFQICSVLSRSVSSQSTTTASKERWRNLAGHPFFNRDRIRERLRSYHKTLTTWQYPLHTNLSCGCSRLTGTWISGLLVKALGMIWDTQDVVHLDSTFLISYMSQVTIAGSSKPPYRHCTLNMHMNTPRFITASFLVLHLH